MRTTRFQPWLTRLVDAALPADVTRQDWQDTGIGQDPGEGDRTFGLVLTSPAGGTVYMRWVHGAPPGGDPADRPENIVTGEPPAPVPPIELAARDGRLGLVDVEQWLKAVIINAGDSEVASVTAYSERPDADRNVHPFGITIRWHNGGEAYGFFNYTLAAGQQRRKDAQYQLADAV